MIDRDDRERERETRQFSGQIAFPPKASPYSLTMVDGEVKKGWGEGSDEGGEGGGEKRERESMSLTVTRLGLFDSGGRR